MCIAPLCAQGCVVYSLAHKQAKHCIPTTWGCSLRTHAGLCSGSPEGMAAFQQTPNWRWKALKIAQLQGHR